jgi:c-di-GMP-related signal transduction protein
MKFKKYRVRKDHIYPERVNTNREIQEVATKGYVFFQGIYDDYYMICIKEYKNKPTMLETQMVEVEVIE